MADPATSLAQVRGPVTPQAASILAALAFPVIVVAPDDAVCFVNAAAEQFFDQGAPNMVGLPLIRLVPADNPIYSLIAQVRNAGATIAEHDMNLTLPRSGTHELAVNAAPLADGEGSGFVVLSLHERATAQAMQRQLAYRGAARSVTAMAAMLAHEVKNPLSGIRGAAQLLEQTVGDSDRQFTRLICEETDRICALVDRMSAFADESVPAHDAVNIHEVLERVQSIAAAGFARHVAFTNEYDPSLPPVYGNRDQLIQVFLNLVKNAAEAVSADGGEIHLATAFRGGMSLALPGGERRVQLPLLVTIGDNGTGIPDGIARHMFDAFVTGKAGGTGLGLALVAKIVNDHGGAIEFTTRPGSTVFRTLLPIATPIATPVAASAPGAGSAESSAS
jgi:two-component system nitrogen regulation sensor histidine kinase GlnL